MKNITLCTVNDKCRIFVAEDNETLTDICGHADVITWLSNNTDGIAIETANDVIEHLSKFEGAVVAENLKQYIITAVPDEGATIEFDLNVNAEWEEEVAKEEQEQAAQNDNAQTVGASVGNTGSPHMPNQPLHGTEGVVSVILGGGIHVIPMAIINGQTTVHEVVYSNDVRQRSGMTDTQISNCSVEYNGYKMDERLMRTKVVFDGDKISLIAHVASDKG